MTAGFAESGEAGRRLQAQMLEKVRGYGMRMIRPNCMGLLNTSPSVLAQRIVFAVFRRRSHRHVFTERRTGVGHPCSRRRAPVWAFRVS